MASPVVTAQALSQWYGAAAHTATCMAHRVCPLATKSVPPVRGQVEFDVHPSFPLGLRDRAPPINSSVINRRAKSVVLERAIIRSWERSLLDTSAKGARGGGTGSPSPSSRKSVSPAVPASHGSGEARGSELGRHSGGEGTGCPGPSGERSGASSKAGSPGSVTGE
eukprot:2575513-Amphidinium_carterae.1